MYRQLITVLRTSHTGDRSLEWNRDVTTAVLWRCWPAPHRFAGRTAREPARSFIAPTSPQGSYRLFHEYRLWPIRVGQMDHCQVQFGLWVVGYGDNTNPARRTI